MDTPGLLDRPESERNEMERLTYASMAVRVIVCFKTLVCVCFKENYCFCVQHLPTAVMFVIDPTGESMESMSA
jgi:GTP1/Obg family GTP-binding protein